VVKQAQVHKVVAAAIWLESKARNLSKRKEQRAKGQERSTRRLVLLLLSLFALLLFALALCPFAA
jgi:hypothetical protein